MLIVILGICMMLLRSAAICAFKSAYICVKQNISTENLSKSARTPLYFQKVRIRIGGIIGEQNMPATPRQLH